MALKKWSRSEERREARVWIDEMRRDVRRITGKPLRFASDPEDGPPDEAAWERLVDRRLESPPAGPTGS